MVAVFVNAKEAKPMDVVHKWPKAIQIWPKLSGLGADLTTAVVSPDFEDDRFPVGAIVGD